MIPSFKIDHSEITVLDSMNICTLRGVSNSYVIYCQLLCLIPNWVLKVHLCRMFDITDWKKKTCRGKPLRQVWSVSGWKVNALGRLQFSWTLTENNGANSPYHYLNLCHSIYFVKPQSIRVPWLKGTVICTPLLSHIIQRTNLFRSLTTIVLLIAQAPAIS